MKTRMTLTVLTAAALFVFTSAGNATILTFDIRVDNGTPPGVTLVTAGSLETGTHSVYGNNVNGTTVDIGSFYHNYDMGNGFTPDVGVSYSKGTAGERFDFSKQGTGWGGQTIGYPVAISGQNGSAEDRWFITFSPEASDIYVKLNEFSLIDFNGGSTYTGDWFVYKDSVSGGNIVASGSTGSFSNDFSSPLVINTGGVSNAGDLILEFHRTSGPRGNLGIDNVNFDQFQVPEPSTGMLAMLALGMLQAVRRRRFGNLK